MRATIGAAEEAAVVVLEIGAPWTWACMVMAEFAAAVMTMGKLAVCVETEGDGGDGGCAGGGDGDDGAQNGA
jgi:hypothetical protein